MNAPTVEDQLFEAASTGDLVRLTTLLDADPVRLHARTQPYGWTLLHAAAHTGQLAIVDELLRRGLDVNARERGDETYAMHWAAAAAHGDIVRRLIDAGGDVIGHGDDHDLEVIGWATCWDGCDDPAHRDVAELLLSHGARHHIFSAIAMNLPDEVRRIVATDPAALGQRMSRNESHQRPLHFAVRMNRPDMVDLLLELGADAAETDDDGMTAVMYAGRPEISARVLEALARHGVVDLFVALALGDDAAATRLLAESADVNDGSLHLSAKRGDVHGVRWLLDHGADPNARWVRSDAAVTPLHVAAAEGHTDVVRTLLASGADPHLRDTKYNGDAAGWAEYGRNPPAPNWREVVALLRGDATERG
jgi:ankyrin repeat protein